jgi:hypothetical protein
MNGRIRVLLAVIMTLGLAVGPAGSIRPAAAETTVITLTIGNPMIIVNGTPRAIDASGATPVIIAGRTLLPIRAVVEAIGGTIAWNAATRTVTIAAGAVTMSLTIGNRMATVGGATLPIDPQNATVVPLIVGGRTMLPVRFVGEQLGGTVEWNAATRTATLTFVPPAALTAPSLLEPTDGALFSSTTVAFRWTPVDGATSYSLAVSSDGKEIYRGTSTTNTLIPSSTVLGAGAYSWTVTAVRAATTGPVSLPRRFVVRLTLSPADIVKRATPGVAEIAITYADGTHAVAGAFFIDPAGTLVTTYEVIKGAIDGFVVLADGTKRIAVQVLGYDPSADVAILRAAGDKPVAALTLAKGTGAQLNQDVVMVGPVITGVPQSTVAGVVTTVNPGSFVVRGAAENAVEGCPVLDNFGDVLGIVTTDIRPATGTFPSAHAAALRAISQTSAWTLREVTEREGTGLQALEKPFLAEPAGEAALGTLTPRFRWNAVAGASKYQFLIVEGRTSSGTKIIDDVVTYTDLPLSPGNLRPGTTYTWSVRAGNEHGWGPWSSARAFTTSASIIQLAPPSVLEPVDHSVIKSAELSLCWNPVSGANKYYVWIGHSTQDTVYNGFTSATSLLVPAGTLQSGSTYLWSVRVESSSEVSSLWGPDATFVLSIPSGLGVPALLNPAPMATVEYLNPTLSWRPVAGATRYDVWIDRGTGDTKVFELAVTGTSCTVPAGTLEPGIVYRWNVIAGNADGWSKTGDTWNWSVYRKFTIERLAPIDVIAPTLVDPPDGVLLSTLTPTLTWTSVQGATWYRIYIGKGTSESSLEQVLNRVLDPKTGTTQQFTLPAGILEPGSAYSWRVLAGAGDDVASPPFNRFRTP